MKILLRRPVLLVLSVLAIGINAQPSYAQSIFNKPKSSDSSSRVFQPHKSLQERQQTQQSAPSQSQSQRSQQNNTLKSFEQKETQTDANFGCTAAMEKKYIQWDKMKQDYEVSSNYVYIDKGTRVYDDSMERIPYNQIKVRRNRKWVWVDDPAHVKATAFHMGRINRYNSFQESLRKKSDQMKAFTDINTKCQQKKIMRQNFPSLLQ